MKKVSIRYLQLEIGLAPRYRNLSNIKEVLSWYIHLVKNPNRDIKWKLVSRFPRRAKKSEYCVIDLEKGCFLNIRDIVKCPT